MKFKKMFAILLSMVMTMGLATIANATELQSTFAITDEVVIIDSISCEIQNNTIQYEGRTYEIEENYTLASYDENGDKVIFVLPVEQNRVTDPEEIAKLNAAVAELERNKALARAIPSESVSLPYYGDVPEGQWLTVTSAFDIIVSQFAYRTNLKLTNFSFLADRRFQIIFSSCDPLGNWTSVTTPLWDFLFNDIIKYQNYSTMRYGMFTITNLYGDPSSSYSYSVYLSNA